MNISEVSNYILEKILSNLEMELEDDFVTENQIIMRFNISKRIHLNQTEINSALYLINCKFQNPVIFSKMIINKESGDFERAFYFKTKNIKAIEGVYNTLLSNPKSYPTKDKRTNELEDSCKVVMSEKSEIYLFTQLKIDITPSTLEQLDSLNENKLFTQNPYDFYVFNSLYANFEIGDIVYVEIKNFERFKQNEFNIIYPSNHFDFIEVENLKTFDFN